MENVGATSIKGIIATLGVFLLNKINGPLVVLLILVLIDYVTGIVALYTTDKAFDKSIATKGMIKKLGYVILIIVAMLLDYVLMQQATNIGIDISSAVVTMAITLYLIATEGISILQNLVLFGVPVPDFMLKIFNLMKDSAGKIVKIPKE